MKTKIATITAVLLVVGGAAFAVSTLTDDDPAERSTTDTDGDAQASGDAARAGDPSNPDTRDADAGDASSSLRDEAPRPSNLEAASPGLAPPDPDATPFEMTENLLGPAPDDLRRVDGDKSLEEALRQHPAFPDRSPETPDLPAPAVENALSRLVQAHGVLTEVQQAASQGDPVAQKLMPYAAAQLATEAERTGPTFTAASDLYDLQDATVEVTGDGQPVEEAASLQAEVDRLYSNMGLPLAKVDAGAQDEETLARIVHAAADVVEATNAARHQAETVDGLEDDVERANAALQDGTLSREDARLIADVAATAHETTTVPLQARLDALETLYATTEALVPAMSMPASHNTPIDDAPDPADEGIHTLRSFLEDNQPEPEDRVDELQGEVEDAADQAENESEDAQDEAEQAVQPVRDELADNFVDPFGAIVILGEGDDTVKANGTPVPVDVPEVGPVGSLFPRSPLLVVDRGGHDLYKGVPQSRAVEDAVRQDDDPLIAGDDLPVDGGDQIEGLPDFGSGNVGNLTSFVAERYESVIEIVETQNEPVVTITADTPAQVVVDLDGDDTYTSSEDGDTGAAYAEGAGTAAVYDRAGDDLYTVERGIGMASEDGFALVKDLGGDDRFEARVGVGAVVHPYTIQDGTPQFEDRFRYNLPGLGAVIARNGTNTYDVEEAGIGTAFLPTADGNDSPAADGDDFGPTFFLTFTRLVQDPTGVPLALDLGGPAEGFQPVLQPLELEPEPDNEINRQDGAHAKIWDDSDLEFARTGEDSFQTYTVTYLAADREYPVELGDTEDGNLHVQRHNATVSTPILEFSGFGLGEPIDLNGEILVNLDDESRSYEPPYPMILVDAGDANTTYRDVSPVGLLVNHTLRSNLAETRGAVAPNLVLDTQRGDRYVNRTAHLNTTRIEQQYGLADDGVRYPAAGTVVADLDGSDTYVGDVATVDLNMTLPPSTMASIVYDAKGSDTVDGEQVAGINVTAADTRDALNNQDEAIGHEIVSLLLMGAEDPDVERNTIRAGPASLGAVQLDELGPDETARITARTDVVAGATVAAPTDYSAGEYSFGSVRWCEPGRPCPTVEDPGINFGVQRDMPRLAGLFVGSGGEDTYTVDGPKALGHVTLDPAHDRIDSPCQGRTNVPEIVTRFVEPGGPSEYRMTDRNEEIPPWRNDASWRPYDCEPAVTADRTAADLAGAVAGDDAEDRLETELVSEANARHIDTLGVDNLAQYVFGTAAGDAGETARATTGTQLEPPELCAGPFAVSEDGSALTAREQDRVLVGFDHPDLRCGDERDPTPLDDRPVTNGDRLLVATQTRGTVPANVLGAVNPCDPGQDDDRFLELEARESNVPDGNPLAHGTSGCWATLEVKRTVRDRATGPVWSPDAPEGNGWLDIMAAPVHCGYTDDSQQVRCSTDAFPVPHHVDGTEGYNLERWFLPDGAYEFRVRFNGPIGALLGTNSTFTGEMTVDRDPVHEPERVPGHEVEVETNTTEGLFTWLQDREPVGPLERAFDALDLRTVHLDSTGEPETAELWSPFPMSADTNLQPLVCVDGTPYRGQATEAEDTWRGDRGYWVTTYPLELWEEDDARAGPPETCDDVDAEHELDQDGEHTVEVSLWDVGARELERVELPDAVTSETAAVDNWDPDVRVAPLLDADGTPIRDGPDVDDAGVGLRGLMAPTSDDGTLSTSDLNRTGGLHAEVPLQAESLSPISELTVGEIPDQPWSQNRLSSAELSFENKVVTPFGDAPADFSGMEDHVVAGSTHDVTIDASHLLDDPNPGEIALTVAGDTYENDDGETVVDAEVTAPDSGVHLMELDVQGFDTFVHRLIVYEDGVDPTNPTIDCTPSDPALEPASEACSARLNLTWSGQRADGTWARNATVNVTLEPGKADGGHWTRDLQAALNASLEENRPLTLTLPDAEAVDEAGNAGDGDLGDVRVDLDRPSDLAFPCDGDGLTLVTNESTFGVRSYHNAEDVEKVFLERRNPDGNWSLVRALEADELTQATRSCEQADDGEWLVFEHTVKALPENATETLDLRTITVDEAGNRERSTVPFEFSVTVDQSTPNLTAEQRSASPTSATVELTADEPVTVDEDVALLGPDGTRRAPLHTPRGADTSHTLPFEGLTVNTTYELVDATVTDAAGNALTADLDVRTASTLNLSLAETPDVAGDQITLAWTAGAIPPDEGGEPMTRVEAVAAQDGEPCNTRSAVSFVDAPIDEPAPRNMSLGLAECPAGNLTVSLTIDNGPEDDPLERIILETTVTHDTETPTPTVRVDGETSDTGWYTQPIRVTPTGEDDTRIAHAEILDGQDALNEIVLDDPGRHTLTVRAVDAAGRSAIDTVELPLDLHRPDAELVSLDELPTEQEEITVQVKGVDDASGLASIRTMQADGTFSEWGPVDADMKLRLNVRGLDEVVAEIRDRAGHATQAVLPVTTLVDPPTVRSGDTRAVNAGTVEVTATLDRPVALQAVAEQDGRLVAENRSEAGEEHRLTLPGLTPATATDVTVRAELSDGSTATLDALSRSLRMPASLGPPTVPTNATAETLEDGSVKLDWEAATDDAGIARYLVERRTQGVVTEQWSIDRTQLLDTPGLGQEHEYRVQAMDLAGRSGSWSEPVTVTPQQPLEIVSYEISPEVAAAGTPVNLTVVAEGSQAPGTATVEFGNEKIPLTLEEGSDGRWVYTATVTLPSTDTFFPQGITVHMGDRTFPAEGTFPGPVVKALQDDEISTTSDTPAPGLLVALVAGSLAALTTRRWTR